MKKELNYFNIEELYGGDQERLKDFWMHVGGCAAVTACDLSIYMDLYKGTKTEENGLYPFELTALTKADYDRFAMLMKPYLRPRFSGIDKLEIYLKGFGRYLDDHGCSRIRIEGFSNERPYEEAVKTLISRIDHGFPVPYLNLRHKDKTFSDFEWHWFLLTGYEVLDDTVMVKVVSYGEYVWFDFQKLWNTGCAPKGGMILVWDSEDPADCDPAKKALADGDPANPNTADSDSARDSASDSTSDSARDSTSDSTNAGPAEAAIINAAAQRSSATVVAEERYGLTDQYLFERLSGLTSIDSLSFHEREMADRLKAELEALGIHAEEDDAAEKLHGNAGNLYAFVKGTLPGPPILLSAHMDTVVPGTGKKAVWDKEAGIIRSDGTTVLGADDASGILEILEALRIMGEKDYLPHRDLEILFTVGEEAFGYGANAFDCSRIQAREAYVLDVNGPVGTAVYKAPTILSFEARILGRAAHAGFEPEAGIHAIQIMSRAVASLKLGHLDEETTCNIGTVQGGKAVNIVPAEASCRGEIRSYRHEKALETLEEVRRAFQAEADAAGAGFEFSPVVHLKAFETDSKENVFEDFRAACDMISVDPEFRASFGGSDQNVYAQYKIPGLVLSCGMENIHTTEEYIRIEDIRRAIMLILGLVIQ